MMSVDFLKNATSTAKYFSHEDSYYLSEEGAKESGRWFGVGAKNLGLIDKKVNSQDLENLLSGQLPNGETVGISNSSGHQHRPGIQLVFSAPKSVSILTLVSEDKALSSALKLAHQNAVHYTLSRIERDCAQSRYKEKTEKNEKSSFRYENTKNIIAAVIDHSLSRENDPQLHSHTLIMNITQRLDGMWRSMASAFNNPNSDEINGFNERVINNKIYYGAVYRSKLAETVKSLGFEVEIVGKHGLWEIKNFPKVLLSLFSKRSDQVLETAKKADYQTQKTLDTAATISKRSKENSLSIASLQKRWHSEIEDLKFNLSDVQQSIKNNSYENSKLFSDEKVNEVVNDIINHFSNFQNKIPVSKVIEKVMTLYPGDVSIDSILNSVHKISKESKIVFLNEEKSHISTQTALAREKNIIELINESKNTFSHDIKKYKNNEIKDKNNESTLCKDILMSTDRCHLIDVKSKESQVLYSELLKTFESNNKTVQFITANSAIADDIARTNERKPESIWQMLKNMSKPELVKTVSGFLYEKEKSNQNPLSKFRQEKDIVIIDSVEKISLSDIEKLLALTSDNKTKLVFVSNINTKVLSAGGNSVSTIKQSSIKTHSYEEKNVGSENHINTLLISEEDEKKRAEDLAKAYCMLNLSDRKNTGIVSYNKKSIDLITDSIRRNMKEAGNLKNEYRCTVLNPVNLSSDEKKYAASYKEGLILRSFVKNLKTIDFQVIKIDREKNCVFLKSTNQLLNFEKKWNPKEKPLNASVFEKKNIGIAIGDKIVSTQKNHDLDIKSGAVFHVKSIDEKSLQLIDENHKVHKISKKSFENSHFDYDYARTLSRSSKKSDNVLFFTKAYAIDKEIVSSLKNLSQKNIIIFSDKKEETEYKLKKSDIKPTAYEILNDVISSNAIINPETIDLLKSDIASVIEIINDKKPDLSQKAVQFAIDKLSNKDACFTHKALLQEAIIYAMDGRVTISDLEKSIKDAQQSDKLIISQAYHDGTRWTTKDALDTENRIIEIANDSINKKIHEPILSKESISNDATSGLTGGQKAAYRMIMTSSDQLLLLQGAAGVGKTTLFQKINEDLKNTSVSMIAVAPTHQTVKELQDRNIEAMTLKSFLIDNQYNFQKQQNKLIVLDEASMVSNRDMKAFLEIINRLEMRSVIAGDKDQIASIESGKTLDLLLNNTNLDRCIIKDKADIVRQKNELLKSAVVSVIDKKYDQAISILKNIKPDEKLWKNDTREFEKLKSSIVEVKENVFERIANDYLSRTDNVRENTRVIVHENEDRKIVDNLIRGGLINEGVINNNNVIEHSRLVSRNYTQNELSNIKFYKKNEIIKIKDEYFSIEKINIDKNAVTLTNFINNKIQKVIFPGADTKNAEVFKIERYEIAQGDKIRLRKSDKESDRFANFEYQVKKIDGDIAHLESDKGQRVTFEKNKLSDAHWDYAYTSTGYSIQGASSEYTIGLELSIKKHLTNARNFYVHISRAKENAIIYTDDIQKLSKKIDKNRAIKLSAVEMLSKSNDVTRSKTQHSISDYQSKKSVYEFKMIDAHIKSKTTEILLSLFGEPNQKLSSENNWRYGHKGSLSVQTQGDKAGLWHSFESGESGNLLQLIQKETGYQFKDVISLAKRLSGEVNFNQMHPPVSSQSKKIIPELINPDAQDKIDRIVKDLKPMHGTVVEKYLREVRKIDDLSNIKDIYYHNAMYDSSSTSQIKNKPAMVVVGRDGNQKIVCLQATFLDPKTGQKASDTEIKKRSFGKVSGNPAIIQDAEQREKAISFIAEGVETALSVKQITGAASKIFVTMGVSNLKNVPIDKLGKTVVIIADNDGANANNLKRIDEFAKQLIDHQKTVLIATPNKIPGLEKSDYNDVLIKQGVSAVKRSISQAVFYDDWKKIDQDALAKSNSNIAHKNHELVR